MTVWFLYGLKHSAVGLKNVGSSPTRHRHKKNLRWTHFLITYQHREHGSKSCQIYTTVEKVSTWHPSYETTGSSPTRYHGEKRSPFNWYPCRESGSIENTSSSLTRSPGHLAALGTRVQVPLDMYHWGKKISTWQPSRALDSMINNN